MGRWVGGVGGLRDASLLALSLTDLELGEEGVLLLLEVVHANLVQDGLLGELGVLPTLLRLVGHDAFKTVALLSTMCVGGGGGRGAEDENEERGKTLPASEHTVLLGGAGD